MLKSLMWKLLRKKSKMNFFCQQVQKSQLFDVAALTDVMKNHEIMRCTYDNAVVEELAFRGLDIGKEEMRSCLIISGR